MTAAPLRVFVSTGEASGELLAADLIGAMRKCGASVDADGIGGERLEGAGVRLTQRSAKHQQRSSPAFQVGWQVEAESSSRRPIA